MTDAAVATNTVAGRIYIAELTDEGLRITRQEDGTSRTITGGAAKCFAILQKNPDFYAGLLWADVRSETGGNCAVMVLTWSDDSGLCLNGPFDDAKQAGDWAEGWEYDNEDPRWHVVRVDPTKPLPLNTPNVAADEADGCIYVLEIRDDQPSLTGPFDDGDQAAKWIDDPANNVDDSWQIVALAGDPRTPLPVITPAGAD